jgi:hypothetical protein
MVNKQMEMVFPLLFLKNIMLFGLEYLMTVGLFSELNSLMGKKKILENSLADTDA